MCARFLFIVAACCFLALNVNGLQTVNGRIKVTIQTTSGCIHTMRFIENNLAPTYALYKDFMDVEFVPWGRARRADDGSVICQFGVNDCWANRLHRCALNMLKGNQDAQVHYMTCEYISPYPSYTQGTYQCANAVGLNLVDVDYCVSHPGDDLDLAAEVKGNELTLALDGIPSIVFNDQIDLSLHSQAIQRFPNMICLALAADPSTGVKDCEV